MMTQYVNSMFHFGFPIYGLGTCTLSQKLTRKIECVNRDPPMNYLTDVRV